MAVMFFSRDGRRPDTQHGPGIDLTVKEIEAVFGRDRLRYMGLRAPNIRPKTPSALEKNVVVQIDEKDVVTGRLPDYGFYLVVDVRPSEAERRLENHRLSTV